MHLHEAGVASAHFTASHPIGVTRPQTRFCQLWEISPGGENALKIIHRRVVIRITTTTTTCSASDNNDGVVQLTDNVKSLQGKEYVFFPDLEYI